VTDIFVGRGTELKRLCEIFQIGHGATFAPNILILEGETGIGKTKLLERFSGLCKGSDVIWSWCEEQETLQLWVQIVRTLLRARGVDPVQYDRYQSIFKRLLPEGVHEPIQISAHSFYEKVSELIFSWGHKRPLILIVEDIHHARPSAIELLRTIARDIILGGTTAGVGLIITVRSEETSLDWVKGLILPEGGRLMRLSPFGKQEVEKYLKELLHGELDPRIVEEILELTGGNPYLIDTLIRTLIEGNKIHCKEGLWLKKAEEPWDIPTEARSLLQRRLYNLTPQRDRILSMMAVINRPLSPYILAKLLEYEEGLVEKESKYLQQNGFIDVDKGLGKRTYLRLKHGILRMVVYEGIPEIARESIHKEIATKLQAIYKDRIQEGADEIVRHAILGRERALIREYAPIAIKLAKGAFAWEKVLDYCKAYLESLQDYQWLERFEAELTLAKTCLKLGKFQEGLNTCERILQRKDLDNSQRLQVYALRVQLFTETGMVKEAMRLLTSIKSSLPDWMKYPEGLQLIETEAHLMHLENDFHRVMELATEGIKLSQKHQGHPSPEFENMLAASLFLQGEIDQANEILEGLIKRGISEAYLGITCVNLGLICILRGNLIGAEGNIKRAIEISERYSGKGVTSKLYLNLVMLHVMQGKYSQALEEIAYLRRMADATNNPQLRFSAYGHTAEIYLLLGDYLTAEDMIKKAISTCEALGPLHSSLYWYRVKLGIIKAEQGLWGEANSIFTQASKLIQGKSIEPSTFLEAEMDIANVALSYHRLGLAEERLKVIQRGYLWYLEVAKPEKMKWLILKGCFARQKGNYKDCTKLLEDGILLAEEIGMPYYLALGLCELGTLYKETRRLTEAEHRFQKAEGILQDMLQDIPLQLRQSFRASRLFRRVQTSILEIQRSKVSRADRVLVEQELLLTSRMEQMLTNLLGIDKMTPCRDLLLEGTLGLSMASKGVLLLRQDILDQQQEIFLSVELGTQRVNFCVATIIGFKIDELGRLSKAEIREAMIEDRARFKRPFFYLPLGIKDRLVGELVLETEEEPNQIAQKVLRTFVDRGALILDRLYMLTKLRDQYEERTRETALMQEQLKLRHTTLELRFMGMGIVGHSEGMQRVYELVERVAPLEVPVLLQGETGTGKELIARAIHVISPRKGKPFLAINCAAISESLLDSELFGHVKGAFTGADRDRAGIFEGAHGGTLFLDEVEEMSEGMQKKLLRAIEDHEIRRVGGTQTIRVDIRLICATNKDIRDAVRQGKFREDLFYRLNIARINLPPLRERKDDIPLLVDFFLARLQQERSIKMELEPQALSKMMSYNWPGNIRELENFITRLAILGKQRIGAQDIEFEVQEDRLHLDRFRDMGLEDMERQFIREMLQNTLSELNWDIQAACERLKVPRSTLYRKIKELGIQSHI
jgi:transcriptional regulator with GAF, ATPase, and Fis domain